MVMNTDIELLKIQARIELEKLEAQAAAKDVAGNGLPYITVIVVIGVIASIFLDEGKMAAVMGLLGASLTALISMMNGIAGTAPKQERPEFEVIKTLIDRLDKLADKAEPMAVTVDGERVIVRKGDDVVTTGKGK
jgi:hypothetical protein